MSHPRERDAAITPFWLRLPQFFLFPLQGPPLAYAVLLSLASLLAFVIPLPDALAILLVQIGILLAASRYSFKVIHLASQGFLRASEFPRDTDADLVALPWKLFAVLLVTGVVIGGCARLSPGLGLIALALVSVALPAIVVVLVHSASFWQALNPGFWWEVMRGMGWPYLLLCLFLMFLSGGADIALPLLMPLLNAWTALPVLNFVLLYFSWAMSALLGYAMYQYHQTLGIEVRATPAPSGGVPAEARAVDAQVAELIEQGDAAAALRVAYEAQRLAGTDLYAQRRYHRLLAVSDKTGDFLHHAQGFIALLMRQQLETEALAVYQRCRERDADFRCAQPEHTLALARAQWRAGEARPTLALLSGFDKRHPGSALIPEAYELAARVLVQGLGRRDMALPILHTLEARHAQSPQAEEVRWLLREAVGAAKPG